MKPGKRLYLMLLIPAILLMTYIISPLLRGFNSAESVIRASEIEEYAVYNAVIKEILLGKFIVVIDHTSSGFCGRMGGGGACLRGRFPLVEGTAVEDFLSKNEQSYPLKNCFDVRAITVLISEEELEEIFQGTFRWSEYYARYPFSRGFIELSRVGFDSEMDQALVYVGNYRGSLSGAGYYVLLIKEGDRWIIQDTSLVWIS